MELAHGAVNATDLTIKSTAGSFVGCITGQGAEQIRVQLVVSEFDPVPQFLEEEELQCEMAGPDGPYYAEGTVVRQLNDTVWIKLTANWSRIERRRNERREFYMVVECRSGGNSFRAACLNLSHGGMKITSGELLPPFTRVTVSMTLPDTGERVDLPCIVMQTCGGGEDSRYTSGLKFAGISPSDSARIALAFNR